MLDDFKGDLFLKLVFIATLFMPEYGLDFAFSRTLYSIFLYLSFLYFIYGVVNEPGKFLGSQKFNLYFLLFSCYVVYLLYKDFLNPTFSYITLFNNPITLFSVFPIVGFIIGFKSENKDRIYRLLQMISILFLFFACFSIITKTNFAVPSICSIAIIPFGIFELSKNLKRGLLICTVLFLIGSIFSIISDYRVLLLKLILFTVLFIVMYFLRSFRILKITVLVLVGVSFFYIIPNLESVLDMVNRNHLVDKLSTEDTRSFLYENFFSDFRKGEYLTGRGFLGTYFDSYFLGLYNTPDYGDSYIRILVEVGILQLLLKGGIILLSFYMFPLVYAAFIGVASYRENLKLEYGLSIYLFTEIYIFSLENIPTFQFKFFLLFFLSGLVYKITIKNENFGDHTFI